jgi:hypothetical protein
LSWHKGGNSWDLKDKIKAFCLIKGFEIPEDDDEIMAILNASPPKFRFSTFTTMTIEEIEWALSKTANVIWENCALIDYEKLSTNKEYLNDKIGSAIRYRYSVWEEQKNFQRRFGFKRPW